MKSLVKIIHPVDPSTDFLLPISQKLGSLTGIDIDIIRPDASGTVSIFDSLQECSTILFLGHGHSRWLYGGVNDEGKMKLINIQEGIRLFQKKQTILFACDSNEFLTEVNRTTVVTSNYLGFGNMPTDWNDIIGQRESDPFYLNGLDEKNLEYYKRSIVDSLIKGLENFFVRSNSFRDLYLELRLRINKQINLIALDKEITKTEKRLLISMLFDYRDEIIWK